LRPGKRARLGTEITFPGARHRADELRATVIALNEEGHRRLRFSGTPNIIELLDAIGEVPLPPYIVRSDASRNEQDSRRYQTVFAKPPGSVAAPTAGLHFTEPLLAEIASRGVIRAAAPSPGLPATVTAGAGRTRIFIYPPHDFKVADALLTNFHLPRSTLLMLVSAFAEPGGTGGRAAVLSAYAAAIRERYRFFSYGDAMLIL
jgi:S-adenosylmethionine:tRNA ribosyltransferase-isomerase